MPFTAALAKVAQEWMRQERAKSGVSGEERASTEAADQSVIRRAQAAQIMQHMQMAPELQEAQIEQMRAHSDYYQRGQQVKPPTVGNANAMVDGDGNVVGFVGSKPGPDGRLPQWDVQGRPIGGPASEAPSSAPSEAVPSRAAEALAALDGPPGTRQPSMPDSYRKTPKPAAPRPVRPPQPSFTPLVDGQGNVTGVFNNRAGSVAPVGGTSAAPGQAATVGGTVVRKSPLAAGENEKQATLKSIVSDIGELKRIVAGPAGDTIGAVSGRVAGVQRNTIGIDDQDTNDLFHISDNIADQLLRARSGAQINESEYSRLRALTPNPRSPRARFDADLRRFEIELNNVFSARTGNPTSQTLPSEGAPASGGGGFRVVGKRPAQ